MKIQYQFTLVTLLIALSGCQLLTPQPQKSVPPTVDKAPEKPKNPHAVDTPPGVKITPYDQDEIKRDPLAVHVPVQKVQSQQFEDGHQIPAFRHLIQQAQQATNQGQWQEVEKLALDAQRLAPQSAETFLYLSLAALNKNQAVTAESLARRGLSYAQTNVIKKRLWQSVLKAAQLQNKATSINEAQQRLSLL